MPITLVPPNSDRLLCVLQRGSPSGGGGNIGPLTVCPTNANYMATPDGKALWVGGSHVWPDADQQLNNPKAASSGYTTLTFKEFIDRMASYEAANWIRFWPSTNPTWASLDTIPQAVLPFNPPNSSGLWDLTSFNQTQWDQWRTDIQYAAQKSPPVYIQVMLWPQGSQFFSTTNSPWFNNINGVAPSTTDQLFQAVSGSIWTAMTGYAQKWMDTCHDLPNVVWDILGNELNGDATTFNWGVTLLNWMRNYEQTNGYLKHPFIFSSSDGNGGAYSGDSSLWSSTSEMVCPGWGDTVTTGLFGNHSRTGYDVASPPGSKPGLIDNDHCTQGNASPDQVFCTFTRGWCGFNFMEVGDDTVTNSPVSTALPINQYMLPGFGTGYPGTDFPQDSASLTNYQLTRQAIWAARTASLLVNMTHMKPSGSTSTTNRCLAASDSTEFIVYQPTLGASFQVTLPAGFTWKVTWVDANTQTTTAGTSLAT